MVENGKCEYWNSGLSLSRNRVRVGEQEAPEMEQGEQQVMNEHEWDLHFGTTSSPSSVFVCSLAGQQ